MKNREKPLALDEIKRRATQVIHNSILQKILTIAEDIKSENKELERADEYFEDDPNSLMPIIEFPKHRKMSFSSNLEYNDRSDNSLTSSYKSSVHNDSTNNGKV
jgi:hypothetical protein